MFSDKLKQLRKEKGLSQEELAKRLNVVRQTISKWEKGLSLPDSDMLINIAKALDTTASVLLDEEPPEEKPLPEKTETEKTEPANKKSSRTTIIVLLALGSPIWLSLAVSAIAAAVSIYISVWALIVSIWAIFVAFIGSGIGCLLSGFYFLFTEYALSGAALIAAAFVLAGISIFSFFGCTAATKVFLLLTKKLFLWLKSFFNKKVKEEA